MRSVILVALVIATMLVGFRALGQLTVPSAQAAQQVDQHAGHEPIHKIIAARLELAAPDDLLTCMDGQEYWLIDKVEEKDLVLERYKNFNNDFEPRALPKTTLVIMHCELTQKSEAAAMADRLIKAYRQR